MKIVATIEARMSSERLPGKSLMKILGKPMLELLIERVKKSKRLDQIIVATSFNKENDLIENLANEMSVSCYRGSEEDVLDRVLNAAKSAKADVIVELWGDSPLIDPNIIDEMIEYFLNNKFDCIGTSLPNFPKTYPIGFSVLIFPTKILEEVKKKTNNPVDRENVSNYIYEHPEIYKIASFPCPDELNEPEIRLTVDEKSDFELISKIFQELYPINQDFTAKDVIDFLKENPELMEINKNVNQKRLESWDKFKI